MCVVKGFMQRGILRFIDLHKHLSVPDLDLGHFRSGRQISKLKKCSNF
jgi:hypothetical protein